MTKLLVGDQADGLRRLLARKFARTVTFVGSQDSGKSTVVANLGAALARGGRRVLILDGQNGMQGLFGFEAQHDLLHVIRRQKTLQDIMRLVGEDIRVVPAAEAVKVLADLDAEAQQWLTQSFAELADPVDIVLVDGVAGFAGSALSPSLAAHEVVVVLSPETSAITDAYALIKVLSQDFGKQQFRVLVNKVHRPKEAQPIFDNIATVSKRFLQSVRLDYVGAIPNDAKLKQAAKLGRPVIDAFPASLSAKVFRRLVGTVDEWPMPSDDEGRLEGFLQRLIQSSRVAADLSRTSP